MEMTQNTDYQTRRNRHYDLMLKLHAELLATIDGACGDADAGWRTAEQALADIRKKKDQINAAVKASWSELLDED